MQLSRFGGVMLVEQTPVGQGYRLVGDDVVGNQRHRLLADFDANGSLVPQEHSRRGITLQLSRFGGVMLVEQTPVGQGYRLVADDV